MSIGLRIAVLVLLLVALLDPYWSRAGTDVDVVFVVDQSASMSAAGRESALDHFAQAQTSRGQDDRAGLVVFGGDAQVSHRLTAQPPSGDPLVVVRDDATDIERAVRLGAGLLGDARRRRVVLITDGRATQGNLNQAAATLAEDGIGLDLVIVGEGGLADVLVESVVTPPDVRLDEAYDIEVTIRNDTGRAADGLLLVDVEGAQIASRSVELPPGPTTITIPRTAQTDGLERIEVELRSGASTIARNDVGAAAVRVAGPARVLLVATDAADADPLLAALEASGVGVESRSAASGMPAADRLLAYDAVVLANVPTTVLGEQGMSALDTAVRDGGIGLVAIGGNQAYGAGDYAGTALEELLPVSSRITDPLRRPTVAEALVVDSSESMGACHCSDANMGGVIAEDPGAVNKTEIARQAVRRAIQQLEVTDTVGVLAFDTASRWVLPLQQVPEDHVVEDGLAQLSPSGNTDIGQAVLVAIEGLRNADADLRHIVLFTDGFMSDPTGLPAVAEEALAAGITVSVVGTGEGSFPELEEMAERGGGRYYAGRNLAEIPDILAAEVVQVARPFISEGEFLPTVTGLDDATADLAAAPALRGYVATTARPTARRLLTVGEFADPLLATWQAGFGTVTAWTSDAASRWSAAWVGWDGYQQFWTDVVKDTFPDASGNTLAATVRQGPGGLEVHADVPADQPGTSVVATVTGDEGLRQEVTLVRDPQGGFRGELPVGSEGIHLVTVAAVDGAGQSLGRTVLPSVRAYPAEFGVVPISESLLADAVAIAGGRLQPAAETAFRADGLEPGRQRLRLWPWLASLALVLAVVEVGVRRLRLERADLRRLRRAHHQPGSAPAADRPPVPQSTYGPIAGSGPSPVAAEEPQGHPAPPADPSTPGTGGLDALRAARDAARQVRRGPRR